MEPKLRALLDPDLCLPGRRDIIPDAPPSDAVHLTLGTPLYGPWPEAMEVVGFAMGCVWCTEAVFLGKTPPGALYSTHCGYANGVTPNPTNQEVHTGRTNHAEVVRCVFDPSKVSFAALLRIFFETHDPTTPNRQGPDDIGTEYRSGIYCTTLEQLSAATAAAARAGELLWGRGLRHEPVSTEVAMLKDFF